MQSFDVFFDLCQNKRFTLSRRWWFEMPSRSLWYHCNVKSTTVWLFHTVKYNCLMMALVQVHCHQQSRSFPTPNPWNHVIICNRHLILISSYMKIMYYHDEPISSQEFCFGIIPLLPNNLEQKKHNHRLSFQYIHFSMFMWITWQFILIDPSKK